MFSLLSKSALRLLARSGPRLSIVLFHHVMSEPDALLTSEPDKARFVQQLRWLKSSFQILPLRDALARLAEDRLPANALCVTFDDGYRDNAENALPILTALGISATFFITTRYLDGGLMWNDRVVEALRAWPSATLDLSPYALADVSLRSGRAAALEQLLPVIKYLPYDRREAVSADLFARSGSRISRMMMSADEIRKLARAGMEIGGHTVSHPLLCALDATRAEREIADNKAQLEAIIGQPLESFAYPNGKPFRDYNASHIAMLRACGYRYALSTSPGTATRATSVYQLPRFTPWDRTQLKYLTRMLRNYRSDAEQVPETAAATAA